MRWGILSTGHIAQTFAKAVLEHGGDTLVAVGSRTLAGAQSFAGTFGIPATYGTYEELLRDPTVEAVYIGTPHPLHATWVIRAAEAGKHILCEKPLGMNRSEGEEMFRVARRHGVLLMEAFMYRCHPQTRMLVDLVRQGAIGRLKVVRAAFCFDRDLGPQHRLFNKSLGGGGILDLGCYPVSAARLLAGAQSGKPFEEPEDIGAAACLGETSGVDEYASAVMRFPGGVLAEVACGTRLERESWSLWAYGSEGRLEVPSPWHCGYTPEGGLIRRFKNGSQEPEEFYIPGERSVYANEVEVFSASVRRGRIEPPAMTPEDTLGNLGVLDRWLQAAR